MFLNLVIQAKSNKNFSCNWKTKNGFVLLNAEQIKTIGTQMLKFVQNCFMKEAQLAELVNNANSIDELNNINW